MAAQRAILLPPLLPPQDFSEQKQKTTTPSAAKDNGISSCTDIQGLREQIFSNAVTLFPKAALPYMYGHHVPHDIFDTITVRRPRARSPPLASKSAEPQTAYEWSAYLLCGRVTERTTVASGPFRNSIEASLQALLEFLAEKIIPGQHFPMPERRFDGRGRAWNEGFLGVHGLGS